MFLVQLSQLLVSIGSTQRVVHFYITCTAGFACRENCLDQVICNDGFCSGDGDSISFALKNFTALVVLKNQFNVKLVHTARSNQVNVKFLKLVISVLSVLPFL